AGNHFAASQDYIQLNTAQNLNATAATFSGIDPSSAATTLDQLYGIEDHVADGIDASGDGLVRIKAGNVYIAHSSESPIVSTEPGSAGSLQRGVDLASPGDNVQVEGGHYQGQVKI